MADSAPFEWLCGELERATSLDRLTARGAVRIVLKHAGLETWNVTSSQIGVVLQKRLPAELRARGIHDGDAHCRSIAARLAALDPGDAPGTAPEDHFRRLERR